MSNSINFIDTQSAFDRAVASRPKRLAIDTEFSRRTTFDAIPSTLQCKTDTGSFIVDLLKPLNLDRLKGWLLDPGVTKVMHDCRQDLDVLRDRVDVIPDFVFDTSVAHSFVSTTDSVGYAESVKRFFGVTLSKEPRLADWLNRPIDDALLRYAHLDVDYLIDLRDVLIEQLHEARRYEWFVEEMQFFMDDFRNSLIRDFMRVRGARTLSCKAQWLFRELFDWREGIAKRENVPRNWVAPNDKLLKLARKEEVTRRDLATTCKAQFSHHSESLAQVFRQVDPSATLQHRKCLSGNQRRTILDAFRRISGFAASVHNVSRSVFGSQSFVSAVIDFYGEHEVLPPWFGSWRHQIIGEDFLNELRTQYEHANG